MNISLYTLGCKLNYAETSAIGKQFEQQGWSIVPFGEPANAVIINTCTVTENADKECRSVIRKALRVSPDAFVGVTGCYAQLQPEEIASIEGVDAVFGSKEKFSIATLVEKFQKREVPHIFVSEISETNDFVGSQSSENDARTRAFLKLQDGCDYKCSFCTIPLARGRSRSMPFDEIIPAMEGVVRAGYKEVVISGINLGDYKHEEKNFTDIIQAIAQAALPIRVRLSSVEPNLITQKVIETMAESPVFCKHFHIPLQSGSPDILRLMRRRYKAELYSDLVGRIKEAMPDCCIGADVIVGFPSETEQHFEETYSFIHGLPVSYLHVFSYSERENTPAAALPKLFTPDERRHRVQRLRALSEKKKFAFYREQLGTERTFIPEQTRTIEGQEYIVGWTENYVKVAIPTAAVAVFNPLSIRLRGTDGEYVFSDVLEEQPVAFTPAKYIEIAL